MMEENPIDGGADAVPVYVFPESHGHGHHKRQHHGIFLVGDPMSDAEVRNRVQQFAREHPDEEKDEV